MSEKKKPVTSHATKIIALVRELIRSHGAELFHDDSGEAYLFAPVFDQPEHVAFCQTFPLKSEACRQYLRRAYYNASGKSVSSSALNDAIETLAGSATIGTCRPVYTRIAAFPDRVLLDLGSDDHTVVIVTAAGWLLGPCPSDIRFVRRAGSGMMPLPVPVRSDVPLPTLIARVLNVDPERDPNSVTLLVAWWIVALRGRGPYLVLVFRGGSGTAKSNALQTSRDAVDPNSATKNHLSREPRDLVISVKNCYVASFDNVSHLPEEIADAICVLATGGGMRTRKLHTNDEEAIFSRKAPVVINGIPDVLGRADLAARAVVVELQPIGEKQRKTEAEINAVKAVVMPQILGRLLDVLVGVLQREGTTRPARLPRMADVAITLTAAEPSLGLPDGTFIELLEQQSNDAADAVLEADQEIAPLLLRITENATQVWQGELKTLLGGLPHADEQSKPWTARRLANALRRLNDVLHRAGLRVIPPTGVRRDGEHRGKRLWRIEPRLPVADLLAAVAPQELEAAEPRF